MSKGMHKRLTPTLWTLAWPMATPQVYEKLHRLRPASGPQHHVLSSQVRKKTTTHRNCRFAGTGYYWETSRKCYLEPHCKSHGPLAAQRQICKLQRHLKRLRGMRVVRQGSVDGVQTVTPFFADDDRKTTNMWVSSPIQGLDGRSKDRWSFGHGEAAARKATSGRSCQSCRPRHRARHNLSAHQRDSSVSVSSKISS